MKRKIYFGIVIVAIAAVVTTLNMTGIIGKINNEGTSVQQVLSGKTNSSVIQIKENSTSQKDTASSNTVVLSDKAQTRETSSVNKETPNKPQVTVPYDLEVEKADQKNTDSGHSPWKLDAVFVTQVFVSLKVSPEGIQGDYPIKQEELKLTSNTENEAIIQVNSSKTNIKKVYLKRLVKQDNTGIWTVVGYDTQS